MRRPAFTLIEIMAVVALIGLLATATAWSLAGDLRRSSLEGVVGQISHADQLTRSVALNTGGPCVLRFDLDQQRLTRISGPEGRKAAGHSVQLPADYRMDCILTAPRSGTSSPGSGEVSGRRVASGEIDIPYSTAGRSLSYAVELAGRDGGAKLWVVFSGLTGQVTLLHGEDEMENLFAALAAGRTDAR